MAKPAGSYGPTAKIFHWLIALLLVVQYAVALVMPHVGRNTRDEGWVHWHLVIGAFILLVIVARFAWRLIHPVTLPDALAPWELVLSRATHYSLYLLVFVMAVLGWIAANAHGLPVTLLGVVTLPELAPNHAEWGHKAGDIHGLLIYLLMALVALHVAGALYHYFIKRDRVLQRMLTVRH